MGFAEILGAIDRTVPSYSHSGFLKIPVRSNSKSTKGSKCMKRELMGWEELDRERQDSWRTLCMNHTMYSTIVSSVLEMERIPCKPTAFGTRSEMKWYCFLPDLPFLSHARIVAGCDGYIVADEYKRLATVLFSNRILLCSQFPSRTITTT
jgi:hypothetical protein